MKHALYDNINFPTRFEFAEIEFTFVELGEIVQGGPIIGKLAWNGKIIKRRYFTGPPVIIENRLILPEYKSSIFHRGFSFAIFKKEDEDLSIENFGDVYRNLIVIGHESNSIIFKTSVIDSHLQQIEIPC